MDFSNIIKSFSMKEKEVVFSFIILMPLSFTTLFFCYEGFSTLDIYIQIVLSASATITMVYFSSTLIMLTNAIANENVNSSLMMTIPNITAFILIMLFKFGAPSQFIVYALSNVLVFLTILIKLRTSSKSKNNNDKES